MTQSSKMKVMKEQYYLNGESLPTIPVPHDCIIKNVRLKNQCIEFVFEDDISNYDSIKHYNNEELNKIAHDFIDECYKLNIDLDFPNLSAKTGQLYTIQYIKK